MICVLPAGKEDAASIAALERACFSTDAWSQTAVAAALASPVSLCFLAKDGDLPVGYLLATYIAPEAEIDRVGVLPSYRRRGIGKALLQPLCQTGERVFLDVRASNLPAQALYRACGFCPVGSRPAFYRSPAEDAILMSRENTVSEKED